MGLFFVRKSRYEQADRLRKMWEENYHRVFEERKKLRDELLDVRHKARCNEDDAERQYSRLEAENKRLKRAINAAREAFDKAAPVTVTHVCTTA